jgi:hypothetical protein
MHDYPIDREALVKYRKAIGASQEEMALHMRMPFRTYQALESGPNPIRPAHMRSFEAGLLWLAGKRGDASFLPDHLKELVAYLGSVINGPIKPPS